MGLGAQEGMRSGGIRASARHRPSAAATSIAPGGLAAVMAVTTLGAGGGALSTKVAASAAVFAVLAAWWRLRAHWPRAAGAMALILGSVALVVGVALGPRYLLAGQGSPRAWAGIGLAASGTLLLGCGLFAAVRGLRRRSAIPSLVASLAAVAVTAIVVATATLAVNVPRVPETGETPADRGIAFEDVTLMTADGVRLTGWYVPSRTGAAVVVRHGSGSSRSGVLDHLVPLADAGFGVLAPNGRGRGSSDGAAMDFGWSGELDLVAAVDYLRSRPDVDPARIGLVGISLGGMEAIGTAGADPRVRAVVAEGVVRRAAPDLAWLPDEAGLPGSVELAINWASTGMTSLLVGSPPPPSLADSVDRATGTRFLLITADVRDEIVAADRIRQRAPDRVAVWTMASDRHAAGLSVAPGEWTRRVIAFLSMTLSRTGG